MSWRRNQNQSNQYSNQYFLMDASGVAGSSLIHYTQYQSLAVFLSIPFQDEKVLFLTFWSWYITLFVWLRLNLLIFCWVFFDYVHEKCWSCLSEWVSKYSICFHFLGEVVENWYNVFLKCVVVFARKYTWVWCLIDELLILCNRYRASKVDYFFLSLGRLHFQVG